MFDEEIVEMYWARSEDAILETSKKYGKYCFSIAYNILRDNEDSNECVNDTYFKAWNSMPSHRPDRLSTFLGKITRNIALNKYEYYSAQKRGAGQLEGVIDELSECISGEESPESVIDRMICDDVINTFLAGQTAENRKIFVSRYWYACTVAEISQKYHISENSITVRLYRMRNALKSILKKEGLY